MVTSGRKVTNKSIKLMNYKNMMRKGRLNMLHVGTEKEKHIENIKNKIIPFFIEVRDTIGVDYQQCVSFEEFKCKYLEALSTENLHTLLKNTSHGLIHEIQEELNRRANNDTQ